MALQKNGKNGQQKVSWMLQFHNIKNKNLIFLADSFYPEFALEKMEKLNIKNYLLIYLFTKRSVREKRLANRG